MFKNVERAEVDWKQISENCDLLSLYKHFYPKIELNRLINSPFRNDSDPSFIVNYKNGSLLYKDFGGDKDAGNLMQFVAKLYGKSNQEALKIIVKAANNLNLIYPSSSPKKIKESKTLINPIIRNYNTVDVKYWLQFNITLSKLIAYNVYACREVIVNKNDNIYSLYESFNNPIYAYAFKEYPSKYKIYMPNKDVRFICNTGSQVIEGFDQLFDNDFVVITKSLKDCMVLSTLNIPAIAFQSESFNIAEEIVDYLKVRYKYIYIFYDYDDTGITWSNKWKEVYGLNQIFTYTKEFKDSSDYIKEYGKEQLQILIDSQI